MHLYYRKGVSSLLQDSITSTARSTLIRRHLEDIKIGSEDCEEQDIGFIMDETVGNVDQGYGVARVMGRNIIGYEGAVTKEVVYTLRLPP